MQPERHMTMLVGGNRIKMLMCDWSLKDGKVDNEITAIHIFFILDAAKFSQASILGLMEETSFGSFAEFSILN